MRALSCIQVKGGDILSVFDGIVTSMVSRSAIIPYFTHKSIVFLQLGA